MYLVRQVHESRPLTDVHHAPFSYTSYRDMYGSVKSDRNSALSLCVYNLYQTGRSRRTIYNRYTTNRPIMDVHQAVEINLQLTAFSKNYCTDLYGSAISDPRSTIRLCVCTNYTKLGESVVPYTPGVRVPDRSRMFTRRHFQTPPVRICMPPRSRTLIAQLVCVCLQSIPNLDGP